MTNSVKCLRQIYKDCICKLTITYLLVSDLIYEISNGKLCWPIFMKTKLVLGEEAIWFQIMHQLIMDHF